MNLGRSKKTGIPPPYGIGDDQMMNMKEQPEFGLREVMILPDLAKNRTATGIILVILKITSLIAKHGQTQVVKSLWEILGKKGSKS